MIENPYQSPQALPEELVPSKPGPLKIDWQGHTIEFVPVVSHKTFWLATLNELRFDGMKVAESGGFCFSDEARAAVGHQGRPISLVVQSSTCLQSMTGLNYVLLVDGEVVSKGV